MHYNGVEAFKAYLDKQIEMSNYETKVKTLAESQTNYVRAIVDLVIDMLDKNGLLKDDLDESAKERIRQMISN